MVVWTHLLGQNMEVMEVWSGRVFYRMTHGRQSERTCGPSATFKGPAPETYFPSDVPLPRVPIASQNSGSN